MPIGTNMGAGLPICARLHEEGLGYGIGPALLCQEAADTIEMLVEALATAYDQMAGARIEIHRLRAEARLPEKEPAALNVAIYSAKSALANVRGQ